MTVATFLPVDYQHQTIVKLPIANVDTGGGVVSWANPYGATVFITRLIIDVTTASTGACTLDAGPAAAATTLNDTLIDGLDVNSATGIFDNLITPGTNGLAVVKLTSAQFLTVSVKTGASAGLVGNVYAYIGRV